MRPYLLKNERHVDDVIKTIEMSVMLNPTFQSKALCISNIYFKFQ